MLELSRRIMVCVCLLCGIWLYFLADITPLWSVEAYEERQGLSAPEATPVSGPTWSAFAGKVRAVSLGREADPAWLWRVPPSQRGWSGARQVFFKADEPPLSSLPKPDGPARVVLRLEGDPAPALAAGYTPLSDASFQLGSGLAGLNAPDGLIYPWRKAAYALWLAGALAYLLLPWPRRGVMAIAYPRWRVALADLVWVLVVGVSFGMPLALVGGSVQALRHFGALPALIWPLAGLGFVALRHAADHAAFQVTTAPAGLSVTDLSGKTCLGFPDIRRARRAVLVAPLWLARVLRLAAGIGGLLARAASGGPGAPTLDPRNEGWAVELADGRWRFLWLTDASGAPAARGCQVVGRALRKGGVAFSPEVLRVARLFPPAWQTPGAPQRKGLAWAMGGAVAFGPALLAAACRLAG